MSTCSIELCPNDKNPATGCKPSASIYLIINKLSKNHDWVCYNVNLSSQPPTNPPRKYELGINPHEPLIKFIILAFLITYTSNLTGSKTFKSRSSQTKCRDSTWPNWQIRCGQAQPWFVIIILSKYANKGLLSWHFSTPAFGYYYSVWQYL